jgi:hypothetical protein
MKEREREREREREKESMGMPVYSSIANKTPPLL